MLTKEQIFDQAQAEFHKIYEKYKDKGVLGIYLWWSIASDDFNPGESDIDSVAIVENGTDLSYEGEIKDYLSKESTLKLNEPSLRFITFDELNGKAETGYLTKFIRPEVIVLDMPYWLHMAGQQFSNTEFDLSRVPLSKILAPIAQKAKDRYFPFTGQYHQKYFLKPVFRLCYYLNQSNGLINEPFSYSKLLKYQNPETDGIIEKSMEVRAKNWNTELFYTYLPDFENFLDWVIAKYS